MKPAASKFGLFLLCALLLLCFPPGVGNAAPPRHAKQVSRAELDKILLVAIRWFFKDAENRPKFCSISPQVGINEKQLVPQLKRLGIKWESWKDELDYYSQKRFYEVGIGEVKWLSRKRVKVTAGITGDVYPDTRMIEAYATVYINHTRHGWAIDEKASSIQYGE